MEKFIQLTGVAAPLLQINIDTDAIIPSREMKRVSKQGLGDGLFAGWRYTLPGGRERNMDFVLNRPEYADTSILLSGDNFGCGSSREHAVWALHEYGIRAIIAPSFGSIFYQNCVRNGLLPIVLADGHIKTLAAFVEQDPARNRLAIDLEAQTVTTTDGQRYSFDIENSHRQMLLEGLDAIGLTLELADKISAFEQTDASRRPWLYSH